MSNHIVAMINEAKKAFDNVEAIAKANNETPPVDFTREAGFARQILESSSYLAGMQPQSIINAIKNVALCGITLNPSMKLAYLVPREKRVCLDISYMGLIKIATDSGSITKVNCQLVYENDDFSLEYGSHQSISHKPDPFSDRGKIKGVYTVATLHNGEIMIETMNMNDIESIKKRSTAFASGKSCPWRSDEGEMIRKTCIKRASKYWTKTERLQTAIQAINSHEGIDFNVVDMETPKQETTDYYPEESFETNFPKWEKAISTGKKTADDIINMVSTKAPLTDKQQNMIRAVAAPMDAEVVA